MSVSFKNFRKSLLVYLSVLCCGTYALVTSCSRNNGIVITENNYDSLHLAPFVEKGFPYIPTSLDARKLGESFPDDNLSARALALQLGDSVYACFDMDMLRWSVGWSGEFLPMVLMSQVSYADYFNKGNKQTVIKGDPKIATGQYPGWSEEAPVFNDIRGNDLFNWGPLPVERGRWEGVSVVGENAVLHYKVGNVDIKEFPSAHKFGNEIDFIRSFKVGATARPLFLTVAEVKNGTQTEIIDNIAYVYQPDGLVTAIFAGNPAKVAVKDNRYLTVELPAGQQPVDFEVHSWSGHINQKEAFVAAKETSVRFPDVTKDLKKHWEGSVRTAAVISPDTAAYVSDQVMLPLPNPWNRNVRVADIAFFANGDAAVVTFEGDVWLVKGFEKNLKTLTWTRFASGLFEPMSIVVKNEEIFVFGREGIVKLHDRNKDGEADYYENFANIMPQSTESREWAGDMLVDKDGSFYLAKGGSLSNGEGITPVLAKGFRTGSRQSGTIVKVSPDGRSAEVIATGLRGPYLGLNPEKGILTASDQQGNFVPASPVYLVQKGDYFGVPATAHRDDNPEITPPLTWIPHRVDRSSISQRWIDSDKMGPLNGALIHFSFARPGLFRVVIDSLAPQPQGGISFIHSYYPMPTSKGKVNPADGQLYVTGFNLWGSLSTGISGLVRLRYTGKPSYMVNGVHAGSKGIVLKFDSPLDEASAGNAKNFQVKRWQYNRTQEYGSGHFKLDKTPGEELLKVLASYLSPDKKSVFLVVPDMTETEQMEVTYQLVAEDKTAFEDGFWLTVNKIYDLPLTQLGFEGVETDTEVLASRQTGNEEEEAVISVERGEVVFKQMACIGCHSPGSKTDGLYGPPFGGLFGKERQFEDGTKTIADEAYLKESILRPAAHIVKGFPAEMPSFEGILTESDIESVVLYIKSLKGNN